MTAGGWKLLLIGLNKNSYFLHLYIATRSSTFVYRQIG